jgi:NAD(P)H-hydrate epimerase
MNAQRLKHRASTVAMDIPSGLNGDTGIPEEDAVIADLTVTVAYAKQGLLADTAINHVGRLALVPLPDLKPDWATPDTGSQLLTPEFLRPVLPRRDFDFHKGRAGRVGIIAGSAGYYGAAILACAGALRAGGGLVTLLVKAEAYPILASKAPPEVMVKVVKDYREALDRSFDSLGIGPGIGLTAEAEILDIIRTAPLPCILDADAITLLARGHSAIFESPAPRLLTPHPGEMQRLMPGIQHETRVTQARLAAERFKGHTLLLKGARTIIATHGQMTTYNTTGHPGMATGGMGDVLTGVCTALSAQGIPLPQAAGMAAWSSGRAAEMAALTLGQNAVLPSDVAAHLGAAFLELEE